MGYERLAEVKKILRTVLANNRFYKEKYKKVGIRSADQIETWKDFYGLPLTSRQELAEDQKKNPPFGTNLTRPVSDFIYTLSTAGTTTGRPMFLPLTQNEFDRYVEVMERGDRLLGITKQDVFCHLCPSYFYPISLAAVQRIGARMIPADFPNLADLLTKLPLTKVTVFQAYPTTLFLLREMAKKMNVNLKRLGVRRIITVGEHGGADPKVRKVIENAWGAEVIDHIGSIEGGIHAIMCLTTYDHHLVEGEFIPEVLDPETGRSTTRGELVATYLWRYDFPLIRYRTGDIVEIDYSPCECGQTAPRLKGGILGRRDRLVKLRAKLLYPEEIEQIIKRFSQVRTYEIICTKHKKLDRVDVFVEVPSTVKYSYLESLQKRIEHLIGFPPRIFPLFPNTLPRHTSLKAKRFFDYRIHDEATIPPRRIWFSKLYLSTLLLKRWLWKFRNLVTIIKHSE